MSRNKDKKKEQLGLDAGTAANRLKKILMFHYVKLAGHNFCYQCGAEITDIDELSVEHKVPWLNSDTPNELFFDLNNIAFSHLSCNVRASRKREVKHPSRTAYRKGCRCNECVQAYREYGKEWMKEKRSQQSANHPIM